MLYVPPPTWRRIDLHVERGVYCIVSPADYGWLTAWRWNVGWHNKTKWKYYAKRNTGAARSTVYMQREILIRIGRPNGRTLDLENDADLAFIASHHGHHMNGQSLDNRRENLAWETPEGNGAIKVKRHEIPTLEQITAELDRVAADAAQLAGGCGPRG